MDLFIWNKKETFPCCGDSKQFWTSIDVWINKPHCLNKKIGGIDHLEIGSLTVEGTQKCIEYFSYKLLSLDCSSLIDDAKLIIKDFNLISPKPEAASNLLLVSLRFLYPKSGKYLPGNVELIIKDYVKNAVVFAKPVNSELPKLVSNVPYAISFENNCIICFTLERNVEDCMAWLKDILVPKLIWWVQNVDSKNSLHSICLIPTNKYLLTYSRLKDKYFHSVAEFWKESTNPEKYISEDIAIASYLLVLWGDSIQTFVDLGCGNGLLVYILSSEGHKGMGIDVRSRKIWSSYPSYVILKEDTITPSLDCVYPETDWIIGNHSDELSPWLPIIASRSSYSTNLFILPCCPFELNGQKFLRSNSDKSSYMCYIDYLEKICCICGFKVERDRLKIPSTKRICLVSNKRLYSYNEHISQENKIKYFVEMKSNGELKLRSREEKVKNCTQLNKEFLEEVVLKIAYFIIKTSSEVSSWREGEFVDIKELVQLLSSDERTFLKSQCGGLQTLLRNHHQVFLVCNGKVKLRKPYVRNPLPKIIKQKKCWFFYNHPDSCPLSDELCTYQHLE